MNKQEIKELMENFDESSLTKFKLKEGEFELSFSKAIYVNNQSVQTEPQVFQQTGQIGLESTGLTGQTNLVTEDCKTEEKLNLTEVRTPMVGTFYISAEEDGEPFVQVGDKVEEGQIICIIEAMKIMNEIPAPVSGRVVSIDAENGKLLGFDALIMTLDTENVS